MDEAHVVRAARYVGRNPVRSGLVERVEACRWWSEATHMEGRCLPGASWPDEELLGSWVELLAEPDNASEVEEIRRQTYTGRPLGGDEFVPKLEGLAEKVLRPRLPGRPRKGERL
jgi:putative transposase